jgi:hypothetical protein
MVFGLLVPLSMKRAIFKQALFTNLRQLILISLFFGLVVILEPYSSVIEAQQAQIAITDPVHTAFNERLKQYIKLREKSEHELPKLSDKSTPAEIEANLVSLRASIVAARAGAQPGDLFTPDIASHIRKTIRQEFRGARLRQLRETLQEADTKGVPLRVNAPYPETKELIEMPPTLLVKLPALPKQLHYRFVGRSMLLLDKEARLIVDYMPQALP